MALSYGWAGDISVREHVGTGFASPGTSRTSGMFLFAVTDSINEGTEVRQRDDRIVNGQWLTASSESVERAMPRGELTINPRTDDILPFLMSAFQAVDSSGTLKGGTHFYGTLSFVPSDSCPDWTGTSWGTSKSGSGDVYGGGTVTAGDMYAIEVTRRGGVASNETIKFGGGVVNKISFNQPPNEDLQFSFDSRFIQTSITTLAGVVPSSIGSYSTRTRLVDWQGTISLDGNTSYDVTAIQVSMDRSLGDKIVLGNRNPAKFPWSGRPKVEGSFDLAISAFNAWPADTGYRIISQWQVSANEWMKVVIPDARIQPFEKPIPGGESELSYSIPFRGYASSGTPAIIVHVFGTFTTSIAGTNMFSFITAP